MGSHVLLSSNDFGYPAQHNYFETSHAKGEQDAAGAHIKQKASLAVVRREATIQSAEQLCSFSSSSLTEPVSKESNLRRRVFFYVKKDEVNRKGRKFSEVQGNRRIHCIKPKLNESGILLVNTRPCYCMSCIDEDFDNCHNKNYLDACNEQQMKVLAEPSTKVTKSEPEPDAERTESLADLASVGAIVAVAAHLDPNYDILQVTTNEPILLQEEQVDDYACPMLAGSRVLKGYFFSRENLIDMTYRLDEKKVAIINVKSVRCICFELKEVSKKRAKKKIYKLSLEQHEEIMANC